MRCKCLRSLALSTAALAVLVSGLAAADDVRQPDTTPSSDEIRVKESADVGAKQTETPPRSRRPRLPTKPTDRRSHARQAQAGARPDAADPGDVAAACPADRPIAPKPSRPPRNRRPRPPTSRCSRFPIRMESGPVSIEAASFKGVTPGVSTKEDVEKAWGQPKEDRPSRTAPWCNSIPSSRSIASRSTMPADKVSSVVDSLRSRLSRRRRGQATRSGHGSARAGLQRIGRSPRPGLSRARRAVCVRGGQGAGQALDEGVADHSGADLGRAVRAPRRDHAGRAAAT